MRASLPCMTKQGGVVMMFDEIVLRAKVNVSDTSSAGGMSMGLALSLSAEMAMRQWRSQEKRYCPG